MAYQIEVLAIRPDIYKSIETACESLNKVQKEFEFRIPSETLRTKLYIQRRDSYKTSDTFRWLREYKNEAKGFRPFLILVVDGFLSSEKWENIFGSFLKEENFAVFTMHDFDHFVNDITRFCRYYMVRYALSFFQPELKSHNDPARNKCMLHFKEKKEEIRLSLDSGHICPECLDIMRPRLTNEIFEAIKSLLLVVSNQHPYALIIKGGGVKGLAFVGALLELENYFSFDTFAGTSAGSIASVLLSAGYSPQELWEILINKDLNEFKDANIVKAFKNLIFKHGLYPGKTISEWVETLLRKKNPEKLNNIALEDLEYHSIIYSARIKDGTLIFDSKKERKETHASFATRCSMSIPIVFIPMLIDNIKVYDGGLRNNFPLEIFAKSYPNKLVIGLYLIPGRKKNGTVLGDIVDIASNGEEIPIVERNLDKVVVIDPRPIKTTEFNLSQDKKEYLVLSGRYAALKYIRKYHKDIPFDDDYFKKIEVKLIELRSKI